MKITKFIILSLLLCVMFQFSVNAENTKNVDPLDEALGDAIVAYAAKDYKKAVELLEPLAAKNNARAKTLLAPLIFKGAGVDMDINRGLAMIMDAARLGDMEAKLIAVDLNITLAEDGDSKAMYNIGHMCLNGWSGGDIDANKCMKWLEKGAEMGHPKSANYLAHIYKKGKYGVTADQGKAEFWSQQAKQIQQSQK